MNILFLTNFFTSPQEAGSIRAWQIVHYLNEKGHRITVIASGADFITGEAKRKGLNNIKDNNLKIYYIQPIFKNFRKTKIHRILHELISAIYQLYISITLKDEFSLVYSSIPSIFTSIIGYLISKIKKTKYVVEQRDLVAYGLKEMEIVSCPIIIKFVEYLEVFCWHKADLIVAISEGIKRTIKKKGINERKIKVIPNGVENFLLKWCEQNSDKLEQLKTQLNTNDKFIVLFCGTLSYVTDIFTLLKTAALLKAYNDIIFLIIGDGQRKKEYIEFCKQNNLTNCIFLNSKPREEIFYFCKIASVGIHLLKKGAFWECFLSNKIFDYLGSGLPVIFAGSGETAKLIEESKGGIIVEPEDPEKLKDAILLLFTRKEEMKEMSKNGKEYVVNHYSRKKFLMELEQYLYKLYE